MKLELLNNGVRNDLAHAAAVVTEVSWPSFAGTISIRSWNSGELLTHVWSYEHPLGELIIVQISLEHSKVLDLGKAIQV
jgi:hypothetical protein